MDRPVLVHLHSSEYKKKPTASQIEQGEIAVNNNNDLPSIYLLSNSGNIKTFRDEEYYLSATTSKDKTIIVSASSVSGIDLSVNIDGKTIGKDINGVLGTLLLISSVTPSVGVKEEYALMDADGNEISGSTHIKISQTCSVSGETMADAISAADGLGHVTVDSAMTSAGTFVYVVDKYDVASNSALTELSAWTETYVGSGWVSSSITEVIIEDEEIFANALGNLDMRLSSITETIKKISGATHSSSDNTIVITTSGLNADFVVNIDNTTIGKDASGILGTLLSISGMTPTDAKVRDEYVLVDGDGNEIAGSKHIKVYKDSAIVSAFTGLSGGTVDETTGVYTPGSGETEVLAIIYLDAEGKYKLVEIDLEPFILEAEFKDGFKVSGHNIYVKIDSNSEPYLTVSPDGLKLSGVSAAFNAEIVSAATTDTKVKEAWKLYNSSLTKQYGEIINIYKDQHITNAYIGHIDDTIDATTGVITDGTGETAFNLVRLDENGEYKLIAVNMQRFLEEDEFKSGVTVDNHIVHGVVASKSEPYMFVDGDGFYLSGLSNLVCVISGETMAEAIAKADGLGHVTVDSAQTGDHITYTIDKYDVASNIALTELSAWTETYVGSGWVASSITEVIIEDEEIFANALGNIDLRLSALTDEVGKIKSITYTSSDDSIIITKSGVNADFIVNIDEATIGKNAFGELNTLLQMSSITPTDVSVKEEYILVDGNGDEIAGSKHIKIYEDSSIINIYIGKMDDTIDPSTGVVTSGTTGDTALCFISKSRNVYTLKKVNIEDFLQENEFKSGVTCDNHIVHGVVAAKSEPYMFVDGDGFYLSGLSNLVCVISGETKAEAIAKADRLGHVVVESAQTGDHVTYTVNGYDVASNDVLMELSASTIESADTLYDMIVSAAPKCTDKTIVVTPSTSGTDLSVNIDNKTIGKDANGVLATLLLISAITPTEAGVKDEYALMDGDGNEISGSTHIKIGQTCSVSGETMAEAIAKADRLGHVTVDSASTSAGTIIYTVDKYDVAADSVVGSGWVVSSITEVIIEDEEIFANALGNIDLRLSALTDEVGKMAALTYTSSDNSIDISKSGSNTDFIVNVDETTIGKNLLGELNTLIKLSAITPTDASVRNEYIMVDNDGNEITGSEHIKIYIDSTLIKVYIGRMDDVVDENTGVVTSGTTGDTALCFIHKINNKYQLTKLNVETFLSENEFKSGITVTNHVAHGVVAAKSEPYLFVDGDGFYLSGVSASFDAEIVSATTTDTKVKEAWKLYNSTLGTQYGEIINIYKDQHVTNAYIGHVDDTIDATTGVITDGTGETGFNLVRLDENGEYKLIIVNVQQFTEENEFKSGVTVDNHIVHGVVASKSEPYMFVDGDGFYLSGLSNLVCVISGETMAQAVAAADGLGHVTVDSAQTGDHITYTIDKYDIASDSALTELSAWTMDYVGSGWVASSLTEVMVENEEIFANALSNIDLRVSAVTEAIKNVTPLATGLPGQPLLSNGTGAPVWGSYKFEFVTQAYYDALPVKDATTIYFIIG